MLDSIVCPYCESSDCGCVDVETDYLDETTIQHRHLCYCESCGRGFDIVVESKVKKILIIPNEEEVSVS